MVAATPSNRITAQPERVGNHSTRRRAKRGNFIMLSAAAVARLTTWRAVRRIHMASNQKFSADRRGAIAGVEGSLSTRVDSSGEMARPKSRAGGGCVQKLRWVTLLGAGHG